MKARVAHILGKYSTPEPHSQPMTAVWTADFTVGTFSCRSRAEAQKFVSWWRTVGCLNSHSQFEDRVLMHLSWCCPCYSFPRWKDRTYPHLVTLKQYGKIGRIRRQKGKRKPPLWSRVEISGQLRMKNSRTIYIWCKGCTHRDISFTQTYFQIRILK